MKNKINPKVTLINVTKDAAEMLMLAKSTRLEMTPDLLKNIYAMSDEDVNKELDYIANTIPASWEFVDFIFLIQDVTRGFTHQFVRGRHASYAQQTMRVLNVDGWKYGTGPSIDDPLSLSFPTNKEMYDDAMDNIAETYTMLIKNGVKIEDARGILPTNILTNILVKMNLRTFVETVRKRSSSRVQGEYREVLSQMKACAIAYLPWVEKFVDRTFDKAAAELEKMILSVHEMNEMSDETKLTMIKLLDQMRMQS